MSGWWSTKARFLRQLSELVGHHDVRAGPYCFDGRGNKRPGDPLYVTVNLCDPEGSEATIAPGNVITLDSDAPPASGVVSAAQHRGFANRTNELAGKFWLIQPDEPSEP